ncbi:winged helix-turn-helix domain-containing tetratricopeptide repeat protein [Roseibium sp.]|uniref:winged helix-turn-helix domain-containing tetratricopeptide repeat protein n=1 Tax=Roseibium sp. TaxID=1936156 RepID=UPI003BB20CD9
MENSAYGGECGVSDRVASGQGWEAYVISEAHCFDCIQLGDLYFHLDQSRLFDSRGQEVSLRPQSALVLRILAENRGSVVPKSRLIEEVWPHVNVTDDSLTQCIADIRRTIGDTKRVVLQTVPKIGFVLKAPLCQKPATAVLEVSRSAYVCIQLAQGTGIRGGHTEQAGHQFRKELTHDLGPFPEGRIVAATSQATFLEFANVSDALKFALSVSGEPESRFAGVPPLYRVGVDLGLLTGGTRHEPDYVNGTQALQLCNSAEAGQIAVSIGVRDVSNADPSFDFEDLGDKLDGNTGGWIRVFRAMKRATPGASYSEIPQLSEDDLLPTIAVVPFSIRNQPPVNPVLGEIVADDIISCLSRSNEVNVTSRLSTGVFRQRNADLSVIGETLGADFVLSGSYLEKGDDVLLVFEFSEVRSGKVLWSNRSETSLSALLQDIDLANEIALQVTKTISIREIRRARTTPLRTLQSYSLLSGAVGLMHRLLPTDFEMAGDLLGELIERAPNQPLPLSWMARWHVLRVQQGWSDTPHHEGKRALDLCERALLIDPENTLALTNEGLVLTNLLHRLDEAEDRYNTALEFNPNDANGRLLRGTLYAFQGLGEKAKRDAERALHLSPIDPHRFFFLSLAAGANLAAENHERALDLANASLRLNRAHTSTLRVKVVAHMRLDQIRKAQETVGELLKLQPGFRVRDWLKNSPSARYSIGQEIARSLRDAGVPE